MVNGPNQVFIEKSGEMLLTDTHYDSKDQVRFAINHIINPFGRYVNYTHPLVDAHLRDGSRINAVIPPVAQRSMSQRAGSVVVEVKGSHAIYVSRPGAVSALIEQAAEGARVADAA